MSSVIEMNGSVIAFGVQDAAIAVLGAKYGGITAIETTEQYEFVRVGIAEVRNLRVAVEKKRKELKADALEFGRRVDLEAKRITEMLEAIENPLKLLKDDIDSAKERARQKKEAEERAAIEAEIRKKREEQLAAEQAERDRIQRLQEAEAKRLAEERAALAKERAAIEELARVEREKAAALAKIESDRIAKERSAIEAEQRRLERLEFERVAKEKAEIAAKEKIARDKLEQEKAAKAEQARIKRIEAAKPDVEKVHAFAVTLANLPFPNVKSDEAKVVVQRALDIIEGAGKLLRAFKVE